MGRFLTSVTRSFGDRTAKELLPPDWRSRAESRQLALDERANQVVGLKLRGARVEAARVVDGETPVLEIARVMRDWDVVALPLANERGEGEGILLWEDVLTAAFPDREERRGLTGWCSSDFGSFRYSTRGDWPTLVLELDSSKHGARLLDLNAADVMERAPLERAEASFRIHPLLPQLKAADSLFSEALQTRAPPDVARSAARCLNVRAALEALRSMPLGPHREGLAIAASSDREGSKSRLVA